MKKVEQFLLKIDYTAKLRFVIFASVGAIIWIAFMFFESLTGIQEGIELQQAGLKSNRMIILLLERISQHQLLHEKNRNVFFKDDRDAILKIQRSIDANLDVVIENNRKLPIDFSFHAFKQDWNEMKKDFFIEPKEQSNIQHLKLIQDASDLIGKSSQAFRLTSNIDSASHRILDNLAVQIPAVESLIPRILILSETALNSSKLTLKDLSRLIVMQKTLEDLLKDIQENSDQAFLENNWLKKNYQSSYAIQVNETLSQIAMMIQVLDEFIKKSDSFPETNELLERGIQALTESNKLESATADIAEALLKRQIETLRNIKITGLLLFAFGFFLMAFLSMLQLFKKPLSELKEAAEKLAGGDISARINTISHDEIGRITIAFNTMATLVEEIMKNAHRTSKALSISTEEVYHTAKSLESSVCSQEANILEISDSANKVASTLHDFSNSMNEANKTAYMTSKAAISSKAKLTEMETLIQHIGNAANHVVDTLSKLKRKLISLDQIVDTMIAMADQINLLSLNTAIRAGKPGTHEVGFSIISKRIDELANQIAKAALDIESLHHKIMSVAEATVNRVMAYSQQIQKMLQEAAMIRNELAILMSDTSEQVRVFETVNRKMQKQTAHIEQIQKSLIQMTATSQKTTLVIRNLYKEIQELYKSTHDLQEATTRVYAIDARPLSKI